MSTLTKFTGRYNLNNTASSIGTFAGRSDQRERNITTGLFGLRQIQLSPIKNIRHLGICTFLILTTLNRLYNFQNVFFIYKNYIRTSKSCIFIILEGIIPHTGWITVSSRGTSVIRGISESRATRFGRVCIQTFLFLKTWARPLSTSECVRHQ